MSAVPRSNTDPILATKAKQSPGWKNNGPPDNSIQDAVHGLVRVNDENLTWIKHHIRRLQRNRSESQARLRAEHKRGSDPLADPIVKAGMEMIGHAGVINKHFSAWLAVQKLIESLTPSHGKMKQQKKFSKPNLDLGLENLGEDVAVCCICKGHAICLDEGKVEMQQMAYLQKHSEAIHVSCIASCLRDSRGCPICRNKDIRECIDVQPTCTNNNSASSDTGYEQPEQSVTTIPDDDSDSDSDSEDIIRAEPNPFDNQDSEELMAPPTQPQ